MYPKFDSEHHWYQLKSIYHLGNYIVLLVLPLILLFLNLAWYQVLLCIGLWLCYTLISDYRLIHCLPRYSELSTKAVYLDFLMNLTGRNDWYTLMDDSSELWLDESFESPEVGNDLLIGWSSNNRICCFHAYFSEEKEKRMADLMKTYLKGKRYPVLVTYYKKSKVLYRTDLMDHVDYPEEFVKEFYALRDMI